MIVSVGFFSLDVVKQLPSVTNRFFTSCDWQKLFSAEVLGSVPMRIVPTSWLANPGTELRLLDEHLSADSLEDNLLKTLTHSLPQQRIILEKLKVDDRNRDAVRIHLVLVHGNIILLRGHGFAKATHKEHNPAALSGRVA